MKSAHYSSRGQMKNHTQFRHNSIKHAYYTPSIEKSFQQNHIEIVSNTLERVENTHYYQKINFIKLSYRIIRQQPEISYLLYLFIVVKS